jgi:hypothetical protein
MLLPNALPIWIPDGDDILNGLEQMFYFDNGELKSPPCHDDVRCDASAKKYCGENTKMMEEGVDVAAFYVCVKFTLLGESRSTVPMSPPRLTYKR